MSNKFNFFDLTRQYAEIKPAVMKVFEELLDKQHLILGDATAKFEADVAKWIGVKHAVTVASGTDALIVGLKALGVGAGDEIITPAYSFFASTSSIILAGAKPVLVDIEPDTYNMDPLKLEAAITAKTKAIMPVHLYGQCADMGAILTIAKKHGIPVMEDYAQSIGATYQGQQAGTMGALGATSFYPTKNLGGAGDGGLVTTNDDALADRLKLLRAHGMRVRYQHEILGTNSRLDALQCAYLHVKLPLLQGFMNRRRQIAERYLSELKSLESRGLVLPVTRLENVHVWNQFIIRVPNRDQVRKNLLELGVPTEIYYPFTVAEQPPLRPYCAEKGWAVSEASAATSLALPIFPELIDSEQKLVIDALKEVLGRMAETPRMQASQI
ncbi:MAG: DegT/DnrJ/EryC1/StrS family aminotransferase [Bdellovibrionales bacterium]|nr:DegT/DnrJ/EryC1/StrS family aminotransferase [Bdellovibrionales bacterium]